MSSYWALIRSKLDYGATIYGSATKSTLKPLNSIQSTAIRIAIGAFRTSSILSILAKSNEPPLELRRTTLAVKYVANSPCFSNNPLHKNVYHRQPTEDKFHKHQHLPQLILYRVSKILKDPLLNETSVYKRQVKTLISEMLDKYHGYARIYTDGSVKERNKGCTIIYEDNDYQFKLPKFFNIFSCEVYAIYKAIELIQRNNLLFLLSFIFLLKFHFCKDFIHFQLGKIRFHLKIRQIRFSLNFITPI